MFSFCRMSGRLPFFPAAGVVLETAAAPAGALEQEQYFCNATSKLTVCPACVSLATSLTFPFCGICFALTQCLRAVVQRWRSASAGRREVSCLRRVPARWSAAFSAMERMSARRAVPVAHDCLPQPRRARPEAACQKCTNLAAEGAAEYSAHSVVKFRVRKACFRLRQRRLQNHPCGRIKNKRQPSIRAGLR